MLNQPGTLITALLRHERLPDTMTYCIFQTPTMTSHADAMAETDGIIVALIPSKADSIVRPGVEDCADAFIQRWWEGIHQGEQRARISGEARGQSLHQDMTEEYVETRSF